MRRARNTCSDSYLWRNWQRDQDGPWWDDAGIQLPLSIADDVLMWSEPGSRWIVKTVVIVPSPTEAHNVLALFVCHVKGVSRQREDSDLQPRGSTAPVLQAPHPASASD